MNNKDAQKLKSLEEQAARIRNKNNVKVAEALGRAWAGGRNGKSIKVCAVEIGVTPSAALTAKNRYLAAFWSSNLHALPEATQLLALLLVEPCTVGRMRSGLWVRLHTNVQAKFANERAKWRGVEVRKQRAHLAWQRKYLKRKMELAPLYPYLVVEIAVDPSTTDNLT